MSKRVLMLIHPVCKRNLFVILSEWINDTGGYSLTCSVLSLGSNPTECNMPARHLAVYAPLS